ncbi:hypothetical protein [Schleiferilactobacillus harbinensis]|jgi:hypothetical protein|uniref:hypothetical protein n=1 Tax=Schleiferilactobacillus harbinensis TaxID=304207 RepID=UPI00123B7C1B|nr:hypothetical protein [Schleiferilactobacillus harbinensis]QEU48696.1 hypothetical protein FMM01_15980 [Schleiferilactobacillus harbinensis]
MNGETRYIGQGAGKMTLDEAYTKLPVNSTLVFDPGVYTIPGLSDASGLSFEGAGENADDVQINANFMLDHDSLSLKNLHLNGNLEKLNCVNVLKHSSLTASNVSFTNSFDTCPVAVSHSRATLIDCSLTRSPTIHNWLNDTALVAVDDSQVEATGCDFGSIGLMNARMSLGTSLVRTVVRVEGSELKSDALYIADIPNTHDYFYITDHSVVVIGQLHLPDPAEEDTPVMGDIIDSEIHVQTSNIDADRILFFQNLNRTSVVDIDGALIRTNPDKAELDQ